MRRQEIVFSGRGAVGSCLADRGATAFQQEIKNADGHSTCLSAFFFVNILTISSYAVHGFLVRRGILSMECDCSCILKKSNEKENQRSILIFADILRKICHMLY